MGERERWGKSQTETDRQTEGAGEREERTQRGWGKDGGREGGETTVRWERELDGNVKAVGGGGGNNKSVKIAFHREEQKDRDIWTIHLIYFVNV